MKSSTLVLKSFLFYRRTNLAVLAGAAVASAVLVGALAVGDSVRYSLERLALARLGKTQLVLAAGDRFFSGKLADEIAASLGAEAAPVVRMTGIAATGDASVRANGVQVLGVDDRFWRMGRAAPPFPDLGDDTAAVNAQLAEKLGLEVGDWLLVRIGELSFLPLEAPLAARADSTVALRVAVAEIVGDERFGRFGLAADQAAPLTVFLPIDHLSRRIERPGKANVILLSGQEERTVKTAEARAALKENWRPADAAFSVRRLRDSGAVELRSERVFIDPPIAEAALAAPYEPSGVLSYFVNELRSGERSTPYSVVSAPGAGVLRELGAPGDLGDDGIVVNEWLARDLAIGPGDPLEMKYYVLGASGELTERSSSFRVASVVPIAGAAADRTLMPDFPGVAAAETTRDWDPGFPVDLSRVRQKDEDYWYEYRGTPKAFVTLPAARGMWENRFGGLTAVRFRGAVGSPEELGEQILERIDPASLGFIFTEVRSAGLRAASQGVDFGQLFVGLSMFLVIAAVLLTGLLFVLAADERSGEIGILLAVGFTPSQVRRLLLAEGALLAVVGAAAGAAVGAAYNLGVLYALSTIWRGAVRTSALRVDLKAGTLLVGSLAGTALSIAAMWLTLRRQTARSAGRLQALLTGEGPPPGKYRAWVSAGAAACAAAGAVAIILLVAPGRTRGAAGAFFASGAMLLASGVALWDALLVRLSRAAGAAGRVRLSITGLAVGNCARRRGRSLATIGVVACGVFLVMAVGANRRDPLANADKRPSGAGGFALWAETSLPVLSDLNSRKDRRKHGLDSAAYAGARVVNMRVREGDDASCFNLNRAANPRVLGLRPGELAERGAFTFTATDVDPAGASPWLLLERDLGPDVVPAIADETVIVWGLGKSVGDTLSYVDERGRPFKLKLVAGIADSLFQGSVIVSEDAFVERFPSSGGWRAFLIDAPRAQAGDLSRALSRSLEDFGVDVVPAARRLADFNTVRNTYLSIFLALGGLGLLLGSAGMGVVVLRNVLERRGELAILRAVGFSRGSLLRMLLREHWLLLGGGAACGAPAAFVAVFPALSSPGAEIPYGALAAVLAGVVLSGGAWTYLATRLALRGDLLAALRNE